jgi:hypothetical protein
LLYLLKINPPCHGTTRVSTINLSYSIYFFFLAAEAQMGASMLRSINRGIYDPSVVPYEGSPYLTNEFVESVVLTTNNVSPVW